MPPSRAALRRALSFAVLAGCLPLLLADSAEDPPECKAVAVDQAYDLIMSCPGDTVYAGRVRFRGSVDDITSVSAMMESGALDPFDVSLTGSCRDDNAFADTLSISFLSSRDAEGKLVVDTGGGAGGAGGDARAFGNRVFCSPSVESGLGQPTACKGDGKVCTATITLAP